MNMIRGKMLLGEKHPHLVSEWGERNTKTPYDYSYGSGQIVWWECPDCDSEYNMAIHIRNAGSNCPYCAGKRVNQTNCLWTTHPEIAKLLRNHQRGYEITYNSNKKEEFVCSQCNHIDNKYVQNVTKRGLQCSKCGDSISYPEKFIMSMLTQLDIEFEKQKVFEWSLNLKVENKKLNGKKIYDFYVPSLNCIIETHGEQHYNLKVNPFERTLFDEQENDKLKERLAKENEIDHYIILNCAVSKYTYIMNSVLNSKLSELFDLSVINWLECHEFACNSSFVKVVCDMWNSSETTTVEIGKKLNLDRSTVRRYLKQGVELGWCNYNPTEEATKTIQSNLKKNRKARYIKIIQLTVDGNFISEWDSIVEAQKFYKINNVATVCKGRQKTAGGYKWMYKEDYDKLIGKI